jgi:hypothetical protein
MVPRFLHRQRRLGMQTISGSLTISYNPRKEVYSLRFDPASSSDSRGSAHHACQPDGRSCGKVRMNLADAMRFLQKAGNLKPADLLAKTRVVGGTSVAVKLTPYQHSSLIQAG